MVLHDEHRAPRRLSGPCPRVGVLDRHRVRRVDKAGTITNFAGQAGTLAYGSGYGDGRPAAEALLRFPTDMAWRDGNLYILDGYRVRKVDRSGIMTTVAGG